MHEAEQRLTEEQETMLGLQVKPQIPTDHLLFGVFIAIFGGLLFWWKLSKRKVGCPGVGASSSLPSSHVSPPFSAGCPGRGHDARRGHLQRLPHGRRPH